MSVQLKMGMKLAQKLKMTPQLQQSIKILTLPLMELEQAVRDELLENPVLEEVQDTVEEQSREELSNIEDTPERQTWMDFTSTYSVRGPRQSSGNMNSNTGLFNVETAVTTEQSLYDHLHWQIQMSGFSNHQKAHLSLLVDRLNEDGYLLTSLEDIATEAGVDFFDLQYALNILHTLDPGGVGARSLKECLLIQARQNQEDTKDLLELIEHHLPDLEKKDFAQISERMGLEEEEILDLYKIISAMEPKPGRRFVTQPVHYITPDIYINKERDSYRVTVNEDGLPRLKLADVYQNMLRNLDSGKIVSMDTTQKYLRHKMNSALWLIRSINQRRRTMFNVAASIVKNQKDFFDHGPKGMKPMVLKQVADELGVHPSTVSRVTTNKYAYTPHGLYELKYFFSAGIETDRGEKISGEVIKVKILSYIKEEDKDDPISDQKILERLGKDLGVHLARRTVAKYRESLNILSANFRKDL